MTTDASQNAIKIQVPEGFNLHVEFTGAGGRTYTLNNEGILLPADVANDQPAKDLAQRILEVGQRLRDGTVVLSVDVEKNTALFVPANIFGGKAIFDRQDKVVQTANKDALHGHKDWRRITDDEGETLADNWAKVTTKNPEWFWLASPCSLNIGRVRRGGELDWASGYRGDSNPVPVVRVGPALV